MSAPAVTWYYCRECGTPYEMLDLVELLTLPRTFVCAWHYRRLMGRYP